ncbi:hypothetical protein D1BOALGB6SA_2955 [Olavius sp. associated proteobacterium Delta 1]|nr:hypothetical protein D1BOALGB6SA_2955 [Olavius sp. associated proteobacterium Delta 1]
MFLFKTPPASQSDCIDCGALTIFLPKNGLSHNSVDFAPDLLHY